MLKIIDRYIIKTFFGPFLFIFSVLFFIFIVNIIWIQLSQFMGKGLSYFEIIKLLFYLGVSVISLVMPLTILLASIMTFGELGERYELAALKAAGTSLTRTMMPLFFVAIFLSILLFFFSNNIIPDFQRKAKNMLYNIAATKPALNFTPGQFIDQIPGYLVKFDKVYGENATELEGVFIHKKAYAFENQQSILAKKGRFVKAANKNFLKLELYNGYIFEDMVSNQNLSSRAKQPDQAIKFDTLVSHFDISEIIKKAIDDEKITDDYRFQTYNELDKTITTTIKDSRLSFKNINTDLISQTNNYIVYIDQTKSKDKIAPQFDLSKIQQKKKNEALLSAYQKLENLRLTAEQKDSEIQPIVKYYSKVVMYQQRIVAYSVTCVIFFLIGASLGSIIRKGGMGLPVIIAIVIFIIFYVLNLSVENIAWNGTVDPYLAAWLPNMLLLPFGTWLTYKALTDSQLFDVEKYKALFKPIISKFIKNKEHKRYQ
ncbi:MAG: LptF/LptG family permease [Bacteroidetes bacterium]|nr:LptF/LptG family permease [Bacteroidota bacterium]